jgi:hypothetical protein
MIKKNNYNKYDKNKELYLNNDASNSPELEQKASQKSIAHNIPINVKTVTDISEILNLPLYWVSNINQFALSINGVIFRGNIGNIYNKSQTQSDNYINQTLICKNGNSCQNLYNKKICKFYHDPHDLLQLLNEKKILQKTFDEYIKIHRNFVNTSWVYTELHHNKKNLFMRHFGSRNTLHNEIELIKINNSKTDNTNINNYQHQTMHDILVVLGLNQCGLIDNII